MNRHTADLGGWIMQCCPPDLRKTGVGGVMVQIAGTPPAHQRVRVGQPPEDGIDSCLACSLQALRGFQGHVPVLVTQSRGQCLQFRSPVIVKFIAHRVLPLSRDLLQR